MMTAKLGLLALVMVAATGQEADSPRKRFALFNNCEPVRLFIPDLSDDAADIGLTRERLVLAAESRLRGARLYTEDRDQPYLSVIVNVFRTAVSIALEYRKRVLDPASGEVSPAITWEVRTTGVVGRGSVDMIVSGVSGHLDMYLDMFLTEYLRVNEAACGSR